MKCNSGLPPWQMIGPSAQCIALALVCDIARAGDAVDQLVTWRASIGASKAVCYL